MGQEIERKFLVISDAWRSGAQGQLLRQGYLPTQDARTVRIRLVGDVGTEQGATHAYLTLKGPAIGLARAEYEYPIPAEDAAEILATLCQPPLIEKIRYRLPSGELLWEIDEFLGENQGLVLAEVELSHPQQPIELPPWVGLEVSEDPRYHNSNLARYPFCRWQSTGAGNGEPGRSGQ
jgi:CYTH domain-containing protein